MERGRGELAVRSPQVHALLLILFHDERGGACSPPHGSAPVYMHTYGAMTATECLQCIRSTNGLGEVCPVVPTMKGPRNEVVWRQTTTDAAPANHRYRVDLILYSYAPNSASSSVSHSKLSANLAACQRRRDASSLCRIHRPVWHTQSENVERN